MRKATQQQTKNHNKRLILKTIYDRAEISRASIARSTRLTRTTVSTIVAELIADELVAEIGPVATDRGKPPILLNVPDSSRQLIGVDLADSEFRGAVLDLRGNILFRHSVPVANRSSEAALQLVYDLVEKLLAGAKRPLLGIGIGTPGLMDAENGVILQAIDLDWQNLPLRQLLEAQFRLPVYVANDSHAAALGEFIFGQRQSDTNLVVLKAGRGIGAGIVLNRQLHYGDHSGAGEIGHITVVENGKPCRCGHFGCLETVASSRAIVEAAQQLAQTSPSSYLHPFAATPERITTEVVHQAVRAGDAEVQQIMNEAGHYLSIAIANIIGLLNVEHIVVAGSLARFGTSLLEPIQFHLRQRALTSLVQKSEVSISQLGQDIVVQGAAAILLSQELGLV